MRHGQIDLFKAYGGDGMNRIRGSWGIALLLVCSFSMGYVPKSYAEGRCPPGQYPIGGQGAGGCAPIPAGGESTGEPRATGYWIKTWGAISMAPNGASGTSAGKLSKSEAGKEALKQCNSTGAAGCRVSFTYKNQCVAAAIASAGFNGTRFGTGATEPLANGVALDDCKSKGGQGCEVIYSECSDPVFKSY